MKLNEFTDPLKTYIVTVRVVLKNTSTTVRTSIKAEGPNQAYMMLTRLYGAGNVQSISEIVNESPRTCQIQAQATIPTPAVRRQQSQQKSDSVQNSLVDETGPRAKKRQISARPIASPVKHELVRRRLTRQMLQRSNVIKPTAADLRVAHDRAEIALKKADLEHEKRAEELVRRREPSS